MGLEANCRARHAGQSSEGKARLEDKELSFSGSFRLKIPLHEIQSLEVKGNELLVDSTRGPAVLELGSSDVQKWYLKIRYPTKLLDKLGVKEGQRISLSDVEDQELIGPLERRVGPVLTQPAPDSDLIFLQAEEVARLEKLAALRQSIKPAGAIWVLWPKGQQYIKEGDVRDAARSSGLVDVKVVSVSDRLSGLKLMIPRELR